MTKTSSKPLFSRELAGVIYLSTAILLACSLVSYNWRDISFLHEVSQRRVGNWIGIMGAYVGFGLYWLLGWAANIIPLAAAFLGFSSLFRRQFRLKESSLWLLLFVCSLSCLIQIVGWGAASWTRKINNDFIGGMLGFLVGSQVFWRFLKHGAIIIFGSAALSGFFLALQVAPREVYDSIMTLWQDWKEHKRAKALRSGNLRTVLKTREEEMIERQKTIEKELVRQEKNLKSTLSRRGTSRPSPSIQPDEPEPEKASSPEPTLPLIPAESVPAVSPTPSPEPVAEISEKPKPEITIHRHSRPRKTPKTVVQATLFGSYQIPSTELLDYSATVSTLDSKEEIARRGAIIERALKDFDIDVQMGEITQGATITRYEVIPSPGVKVERIVNLQNNLSLALKADKVNILAPVAGKGTVGIEVANVTKAPVVIRELIESPEFQSSKARIPISLGKDVYGKTLIADLSDMPHLLIAGSTGSGKSVCINAIINSLLFKFSPEELRLILIDPKVVELQVYNSLPHLIVPVVSDPKKVIMALRWVIREMEKRYTIMAKVGVRNIHLFNSRAKPGKGTPPPQPTATEEAEGEAPSPTVPRDDDVIVPDKLPFVVVVIDELADLMLTAPVDAEDAITRITQMARAAGIHLIVATQTPRADVVTGTIKTNLPAKIAFRVASKIDSRVILDENGAENLLGKGDMIYKSSESSTHVRAQGAFISDEEVRKVVDGCARQIPASYDEEIHEKISKPIVQGEEEISEEDEQFFQRCLQVVCQEKRASTSLLQRRLKLGYTRAARMMDLMEERGYVGPAQGARDREILFDMNRMQNTLSSAKA